MKLKWNSGEGEKGKKEMHILLKHYMDDWIYIKFVFYNYTKYQLYKSFVNIHVMPNI